MKKLLLPFLCLIFTGCASLPFRITGWSEPQEIQFENGKKANVLGRPRMSCYRKDGELLADGYFVTVLGHAMVIDRFGKGYSLIEDKNSGNFCIFNEND